MPYEHWWALSLKDLARVATKRLPPPGSQEGDALRNVIQAKAADAAYKAAFWTRWLAFATGALALATFVLAIRA